LLVSPRGESAGSTPLVAQNSQNVANGSIKF
jgi:hypothetical protein